MSFFTSFILYLRCTHFIFDDQKLPLFQAAAEFCLEIATGMVADTGFMRFYVVMSLHLNIFCSRIYGTKTTSYTENI